MEKMSAVRSICRAASFRSSIIATANNHHVRQSLSSRTLFGLSSPSVSIPSKSLPSGCTCSFSEDVAHMPDIKDPEIERFLKDLMAEGWDEIPESVLYDVKKALLKDTDDKAGQEVLKTALCAAEAVEEFTGIIMNIKMEIDNSIGMSGADVKPLPDDLSNSVSTVYQSYSTYLDAFGPEESYLQKMVGTDLGSKMIFLKMRCSGLGSEWGKSLYLQAQKKNPEEQPTR
ncbi:succinate dehydrogenase subunit 5, mitochondrial-like isoform X1 [Mangifera indica]|uniref:succinate dehydrogenase subunit 5, mitochondrial-like isoform X1 n=1 Tax=Mangifera indica TaxID=29780 RepID=UPI001CF99549|nr:succinate dehydrogenase subunit 5, mitochondrial-like isoform X1 [Mangifera indica]